MYLKIGPNCLFFGPSWPNCLGPYCLWAELSDSRLSYSVQILLVLLAYTYSSSIRFTWSMFLSLISNEESMSGMSGVWTIVLAPYGSTSVYVDSATEISFDKSPILGIYEINITIKTIPFSVFLRTREWFYFNTGFVTTRWKFAC